jgi:cytochrome P450
MKTLTDQIGSRVFGSKVSRNDLASQPAPFLVPPITPPARPLSRLAFVARFLRNPLLVIPQAVYEQDFVPFNGGSYPFAWITEPGLIKAMLLDEHQKFEKSVQIRVLGPLLGKGILTSEGPEWKWQRQTSAPMFRHNELMAFVPSFVRAARQLLDRWRLSSAGSRQQVERDMTRATFDVVCSTLLPSGDATVATTVETSTDRFQKSGNWHRLYIIANAPRWLPQPGWRAMQRAVHSLRSSVAAMVRDRRRTGDTRDDLMHRLMNACDPETGAPMNDEQLVDNLLTFYLAGHETTAMALTWTLYLLALSPEWTNVLKSEVARVTGGAPVAAEHIDKLVLTQQVLKESMRIYPPVPMLSRQAVSDVVIGSHTIRAGTSIVMPIYAIHRHGKRWHDPNLFDPTRFAPENEAKISRYQYLPFGAGPRICIGVAFAMIEATAMLATILQAARFETVDDHVPIPIARVTLHPKGGMPLNVWVERAGAPS